MATNHDAAYAALAARFLASTGVTTTRRALTFDDYNTVEMPIITVIADRQEPIGEDAGGTAWRLWATVVILARSNEIIPTDPLTPTTPTGETQVHGILLAIEQALQRQPGEAAPSQQFNKYTTLGGLVAYARIDGPVVFADTNVQQQVVAVLPVLMFLPPDRTGVGL